MAWTTENAIAYAKDAKAAVLATVSVQGGSPQLRYVGGYGIEGKSFYLNTGKDSAKVKQIQAKGDVAVLFQHEAQEGLKNVTFYGKAVVLEAESAEAKKGLEVIKARRPQAVFDDSKVIVRVDVEKIKVLDFSEELKIQEFEL